MRILYLLACIFIILSFLAISCSTPSAPATPTPSQKPSAQPPATKTFKFSYTMPKGASIGRGFEWFATEFPKRTEGRYKIETYPGSTLFGIPAILDSVKNRVAEIAFATSNQFPKDFPLTGVTSIPTMGFANMSVESYASADNAFWELYNTAPEVKAEFKDFQLLWPLTIEPYCLISKKKEIHSVKDFQGIKVHGSGPKMEAMVTANGGAAVQGNPPDAYTNLEKGVVEAAFIVFGNISDYKLQEICNYFYTQDFGGGVRIIIMNKQAWAEMSPGDQKVMQDIWKEASSESVRGNLVAVEAGKKLIQDAKKTITNPTKEEIDGWEKAALPVVAKWAQDAQALKIDASVTTKILDQWKAIRQKYMK